MLAFREQFANGATVQTICTFTDDTAFTCAEIDEMAQLGTCFVYGGLDNIAGTITGTAFTIEGDGTSNASAQCPGGARTCGRSANVGAGTSAP